MKWLIGLAAGAAVIYLMRTEKGKELIESVKKEANSMGDVLCNLTEDLFKKGKSFAGKAASEASNIV